MPMQTRKGMKLSFSLMMATVMGTAMNSASIRSSHPTTRSSIGRLMYALCFRCFLMNQPRVS